jgi:hypothetical protein
MRLREIQSSKPLSPEQQRVKAMADQAKKLRQQVKQERARQALATAQQQMSKAVLPKSPPKASTSRP